MYSFQNCKTSSFYGRVFARGRGDKNNDNLKVAGIHRNMDRYSNIKTKSYSEW